MGLPTNPQLNPDTQSGEGGDVDAILRDIAEESRYYDDLRSQMAEASADAEPAADTAGLTLPKLR